MTPRRLGPVLLLCLSCVATVTVVPAGEIVVVGPDGQPVAGAKLLVHAQSEPHARDDDPTWEHSTSADGRVVLQLDQETQRACWLLPHGVGAFSHDACVQHPQYGARMIEMWDEPPWHAAFTPDDEGRVCTADARGRLQTSVAEPAPP